MALQHPAVAADQENICSIVQICKAWRSAVQHSEAGQTDIIINKRRRMYFDDPTITDVVTCVAAKVVQFARWLPLHAGIVRSISIDCDVQNVGSKLEVLKALAQHVLVQRLQASSATIHTASAVGSSEHVRACKQISTASGVLMPRLLRLESLECCNFLASSSIVSAAPAATLTRLEISVPKRATTQWRKALSSLSNLRSLSLECSHSLCSYSSSISKLTTLTELSLPYLLDAEILESLPQQLRKLDFVYERDDYLEADLSYLTKLQQLHAEFDLYPAIDFHLPPQLLEFHIFSPGDFKLVDDLRLTSLQQLQCLKLHGSIDAPEQLLLLNEMKQLRSLDLYHHSSTHILAASPIWSQLEHLVAFKMDFTCTTMNLASVMHTVSSLTRITSLEFYLACVATDEEDAEAEEAAYDDISSICKYVTSLTRLQNLGIYFDIDVDEDHQDEMLHLSHLTKLTRLDISLGYQVDSSIASAVFLELTNLKSLKVPLLDVYALPVIGKLQDLTYLDIIDLPQEAQRSGLRFLTQLNSLQQLKGFKQCSEVDMDQFWANVRS